MKPTSGIRKTSSVLTRLAEDNMLGLEPGVVVGKVVDVIEVAQWLLKIRLANPVKDADGAVVENSALVPFVDESCQTSTSKRAI